jgi:KDO2-lipid IV(A) lauroyltransferase
MFLFRLLAYLPLPILYILAQGLDFTMFHLVRYRRKIVKQNIYRSFPEKTPEEKEIIQRLFYKRFADFIVETIKSLRISHEELTKRIRFKNLDLLDQYFRKNQSVVMIATHQFNWEWALLTGCIQFPFPIDAIYQRLNDKKFDNLMFKTRSRFGGNPIERNDALIEIMKRSKRLKALGIIADQAPAPGAQVYWATFMQQETSFYLGAEQIPMVARYPALFLKVRRISRGYYEAEIIKLAEPPFDRDSHIILEKYIQETEKLIKEDPPGWLWSHRRWKRSKPLYA